MNYAIQVLSEELHRIRSYQRTLKTREEGAVKGDLAHLARYEVQIAELEDSLLWLESFEQSVPEPSTPVQTIPEPAIDKAFEAEPE